MRFQVNERVGENEQKDGTGDPLHPKVQWPPPQLCPTCRTVGSVWEGTASEWDEAATLRFLKGYYGAGGGAKASDRGRWHMQAHRKASFDRCTHLDSGLCPHTCVVSSEARACCEVV